MEEQEKRNLSKWDLERELKTMAASCVGLKEATAKKKAQALFEKYENLFAYSEYNVKADNKETTELRSLFFILKKGIINYTNGKSTGILKIKDIEQVEFGESVIITTKTGRVIRMGSDFAYLERLF